MIQAGGLGVSLHDLKGNHPRVSLLTPTDNAVELKQALGRVHRSCGKSKSIQRIIFAAGTVEDKVCVSVRRKLGNIGTVNDGLTDSDLWSFKKEEHDNRNKEAVADNRGSA
jgi:superfamily II DNA or RNA helicase